MSAWSDDAIQQLLDVAEAALLGCMKTMNLPAQLVRKDRAVGIVPLPATSATQAPPRFTREQLEETVLVTQQMLETSVAGQTLPFCAFNGGNDVFVDIGDKSWGVLGCQRFVTTAPLPSFCSILYRPCFPLKTSWKMLHGKCCGGSSWIREYLANSDTIHSFLGGVSASKTLHVGDQFLSAGANDFKARNACTTAWIANPAETVGLLDELADLLKRSNG